MSSNSKEQELNSWCTYSVAIPVTSLTVDLQGFIELPATWDLVDRVYSAIVREAAAE